MVLTTVCMHMKCQGRVINDLYQCLDATGHDVAWTQGQDATQCDRVQNFQVPTAIVLQASCGSNPRAYSVGWCPGYNGGSSIGGAGNTGESCTFEEAETFCQDVYGMQASFPVTSAAHGTHRTYLTERGVRMYVVIGDRGAAGVHREPGRVRHHQPNAAVDDGRPQPAVPPRAALGQRWQLGVQQCVIPHAILSQDLACLSCTAWVPVAELNRPTLTGTWRRVLRQHAAEPRCAGLPDEPL